MPHELPCEVHELILSHLIDDPATLESCSLACHRFTSISQKFLFKRVSLTFSDEGQAQIIPQRFLDLVTTSPHISKLIQSMSIIDSRYGVLRITHLGTDTILPACLPLLNNLRNFSLESRSFSLLFWTSVSSKVKDALEDTFHSQALVNLALYRIRELPLAVLEGCVALQELSLEFVTFTREDMLEFSEGRWKPTPQERRTQLNSLRVALSDPLLHFLSHWLTTSTCNFDISNLQRLSVSTTMEYYDHGVVGKILQASAKALEVFCFSPTFPDDPDPDAAAINPIDIGILPRLRILRLSLGMPPPGGPMRVHPDFNLWTFNTLTPLASTQSIEEISIKSSLLQELQGPENFDMSAWSPLDTFLATQVPSLRKVTFFFLQDESRNRPEIPREIGKTFSALRDQGILSVEEADTRVGFLATEETDFPHRIR